MWHHQLSPQLDFTPVAPEGPTSPALAFPLMSASSSLSSSLSFLMQSKYSFCLSRAWPHTHRHTHTSHRRAHTQTRTYMEQGEKERNEMRQRRSWKRLDRDMQRQGGTARQFPHAKNKKTNSMQQGHRSKQITVGRPTGESQESRKGAQNTWSLDLGNHVRVWLKISGTNPQLELCKPCRKTVNLSVSKVRLSHCGCSAEGTTEVVHMQKSKLWVWVAHYSLRPCLRHAVTAWGRLLRPFTASTPGLPTPIFLSFQFIVSCRSNTSLVRASNLVCIRWLSWKGALPGRQRRG